MRSHLSRLTRPAVLIAACCVVSCSGCGALGLYSLGHSVLAHNHVLKPILPDDEAEPGDGPPADNGSSCGDLLPMERCRRTESGAAETNSGMTSGETLGQEPCHP
ncbi:MAG TPA: hypothetical protein VG125_25155 [Pirellulales bacterium]|nr:hypothetical protein [Pirellulales bacterium]